MAFTKFVAPGQRSTPTVTVTEKTALVNVAARAMLGAPKQGPFRVGIYVDAEGGRVGLGARDGQGGCYVSQNHNCSALRHAIVACGAKAGDRFELEPCDLPPVTHQVVVRRRK